MKRILVLSFVLCTATACAPGLVAEEAMGERFRKVLDDIDARCKQDKLGPYLDKSDREYRRKVANTACNILLLQPRDWSTEKMVTTVGQHYPIPERWLSTPEGKFAHSVRLPAPHDIPRIIHRAGMSSKEYFEALCREEAGTFIFKTASNVEVVFEARPREAVRWDEFFHLFVMEDPYGYVNGETRQRIGALWTAGNVYRAIERKSVGRDGFEHVFRRSREERGTEILASPRSAQYGFVWRGITRPNDREHGIAGGELIVYDLNSGEVMGFRRGFAATGVGSRGVSWEFAPVCPKFGLRGGRDKDFDFGLWFVSEVLQPPGYALYRRQISGGSK